jgi:BlaI family penicillinase repressor
MEGKRAYNGPPVMWRGCGLDIFTPVEIVTFIKPMNKPDLTEGEWHIIREVWKTDSCTAPMIQEALKSSKGWSYSTVRTLMDRMVAKGLLRSEKEGNIVVFRAVVNESEAQKTELLYALKNAFSGALAPLVQCLLDSKDVSEKELLELEKLIKAKKRGR